MTEINNLIKLLQDGGFRSACDWLCQRSDLRHLDEILHDMRNHAMTISDPNQRKLFEQGILAIQMTLQ